MKKGYAPKWGSRHDKVVEEFEAKRKAGKEVFFEMVSLDSFKEAVKTPQIELEKKYKVTRDEFGNKVIHVGLKK